MCPLAQTGQNRDDKNEEVGQLSSLLDKTVVQAYDLSCGVWPLELEAVGSGPSLEEMIQRHSRSSGIPMEFHDGRVCETCQNMQVAQLYSIAQEAIANAVKRHSLANHGFVRVRDRRYLNHRDSR